MIQIMRASAGSGKTFNLARKYITLLFRKEDRYAYRHILAVTFTNKATDEMKSRILKELHILSTDPGKSGYLKWFMPELFTPEQLSDVCEADIVRELPGWKGEKISLDSLKEAAGAVLSNILHDYSAFAVSTIDRFFQQTLKAFSREIGQFASYQVELDKKALINESVDRILDSLTSDQPVLLGWLTACAMEQVEKGERYSLDSKLKEMAYRLKSDGHRALVQSCGIDEAGMYSYSNLRNIRTVCTKVRADFHEKVRRSASAVLDLLDRVSVSPEQFNRKFMSRIRQYTQIAGDDIVCAPSPSFMEKAADHESWFSKTAMKTLHPLVYPALEGPLEEFCSCFGQDFKVYNTALILLGQLYELGVATDLYREFDAVMKEKNVLSIDDSNTILKNIIDGSDAPFIYEKTGVRFENFLLDEFQDTSSIQWENFRPLICNSIAQGEENLIVGDVKQSIYRWRGSDWSLLDSGIRDDLSGIADTVLDRNFRSFRNIVEFNNDFFPYAAGVLDCIYGDKTGKSISEIYSDVRQEVASKSGEQGSVRITFCDADDEIAQVSGTISMLREAGARWGDIAVLVRNNASGGQIAEALIAESVPVITDDSLKIKSSQAVRRLVSLMSFVDNPSDTVNSFLAASLDVCMPREWHSLADLCEALCRSLREYDGKAFDAEATYIQSFVDCVLDYASTNGNDLHDFLRFWADADPVISSPSLSDAVRIMTVHKAKGLDFGYVIFPYAEKVGLFRPGSSWCMPDLRGTALESVADGVYDVCLSESSTDTLFSGDFLAEKKKQYIDNINIFYVALTRAVKGMHIISAYPSSSFLTSLDKGIPEYRNFSHILYAYLDSRGAASGFSVPSGQEDAVKGYEKGEMPSFRLSGGDEGAEILPVSYLSYPLNPDKENCPEMRDRLAFSGDSSDFFSSDRDAGDFSMRIRGMILHQIMSWINTAGDIDTAVSSAVSSGLVGKAEAPQISDFLKAKIASVEKTGWFSADVTRVLNEVSIIDVDGQVYRPDRVVIGKDSRVTVIDYKFGEPEARHLRQIEGYADLWRRKGYADVSCCIWYVMSGEITFPVD